MRSPCQSKIFLFVKFRGFVLFLPSGRRWFSVFLLSERFHCWVQKFKHREKLFWGIHLGRENWRLFSNLPQLRQNPKAQSTQDAGRNVCANWNVFSFDVACVQCGHPHSQQQVPFARVALRVAHPASCVDWTWYFRCRPLKRTSWMHTPIHNPHLFGNMHLGDITIFFTCAKYVSTPAQITRSHTTNVWTPCGLTVQINGKLPDFAEKTFLPILKC